MNPTAVELTGTLQADGTLVLDQKPNLPAGRVRVRMQAVPPASVPSETLIEFVQRSRQELAKAGSHFMNDAEVTAHIEWLREGDYIDDLLRQAGDARKAEKPGCYLFR